jgi:hypothetical protein
MLVAGFELSKSYHFGQSIPSLRRHRMWQIVTVVVDVTVSALATLFKQAHQSITTKTPYHTLILTGEGWVLEILTGHPRCIHTELGVSHAVFEKLISTLRSMGLHSSHRVSLEEQLSIFLYASVTSLSVRHLGEWFQQSNDTISWWVNSKTKKHISSLYFSYFWLILIFLSLWGDIHPFPYFPSFWSFQSCQYVLPTVSVHIWPHPYHSDLLTITEASHQYFEIQQFCWLHWK